MKYVLLGVFVLSYIGFFSATFILNYENNRAEEFFGMNVDGEVKNHSIDGMEAKCAFIKIDENTEETVKCICTTDHFFITVYLNAMKPFMVSKEEYCK